MAAPAVKQQAPSTSDQPTEPEPAAITQPSEQEVEAAPEPTETQIIPPSGGILDKAGNSLLVIGAAVVLLGGLIGAGIWNTRRR